MNLEQAKRSIDRNTYSSTKNTTSKNYIMDEPLSEWYKSQDDCIKIIEELRKKNK